MPNIKSASDLRNYNEELKDMEDYQKQEATLKLLTKLKEGEGAAKMENQWLTSEDTRKELGL